MTFQDLKNNKPLIRRVYNGKTFSINVPKKMAKKIDLQSDDHMAIYFDDANRIILQKLEVKEDANSR